MPKQPPVAKIRVTVELPASLLELPALKDGSKKLEVALKALFCSAYGASFEAVIAETIRDAARDLTTKTKEHP